MYSKQLNSRVQCKANGCNSNYFSRGILYIITITNINRKMYGCRIISVVKDQRVILILSRRDKAMFSNDEEK